MDLEFERGDRDNPIGHALLYFKAYEDDSEIYATYLVVPPVNIDLAKYMPPMFASKVSMSEMENVSSIPLPPVPEKVEGRGYLNALAESRNDDLINGGTIDASDVEVMLRSTSEAAQTYLEMYNRRPSIPVPIDGEEREGVQAEEVEEVLYNIMTDKAKLGELAKLTGSLRYAVEGNDLTMAKEVRHEMEVLSKYLSDKFKINELIETAQMPGLAASKLSELYTERCYKLCDEDYLAVAEIEAEIERLKRC